MLETFVQRSRPRRNERLSQLVIALAIAMLAAVTNIGRPLDEVIWGLQSRLHQRPASGDIVFIRVKGEGSGQSSADMRRQVASALSTLREAAVKHVFVDLVFDQPSDAETDRTLRGEMRRLGDRVTLVQRVASWSHGKPRLSVTTPVIAAGVDSAPSDRKAYFFDAAWKMPYSVPVASRLVPTLPVRIAGLPAPLSGDFIVDYSFDLKSVPAIDVERLDGRATNSVGLPPSLLTLLRGKTVLLGPDDPTYATTIPGQGIASASYAQIFAAETLRRGTAYQLHWSWALLATALLLFFASLRAWTRKRLGAVLMAALAIGVVFGFAEAGLIAPLTPCVILVAVFAGLRLWSSRRRQQLITDELTGLPNFRALEEQIRSGLARTGVAVVVAKVHRYEEVLSSLPPEQHAEYALQIAQRLKIADPSLEIFKDSGKYFALLAPLPDREQLDSHLRGLRAVFSQPLRIRGEAIDVGITFGVDSSDQLDPVRKIASATAAADETTEALEPIRFHLEQAADPRWNISLQSKIDEALERRQIYVAYQPQVSLKTGGIVGAEALVRWNDPERGEISPAYFIEQCEQAGRMSLLTQRVMEDAIGAAALIEQSGSPITMSINISATLLSDYRVPDMLDAAVAGADYRHRNLVLEVTETARIADYDTAVHIMERIRKAGARLSIDDFGVGAASLETLLRLPFDELKIDRIFTARIKSSQKARNIVRSMIDLGHSSGMTVVAEGVEDLASLELLKRMGCDVAQGWHIAKALKLSEFVAFHENHLGAGALQG